MKELAFAREFIASYLGKDITPQGANDLYEIHRGNKKVLLGHIDAIINIFTKAKTYLEGAISNEKGNNE